MSRVDERVRTAIAEELGVSMVVERDRQKVVLTGVVETEEAHAAALRIAASAAPEHQIEDNVTVAGSMPEDARDVSLSRSEPRGFSGATPGLQEDEALEPGDFSDQRTLDYPGSAVGPTSSLEDDDVSEGDAAYVPPTDPVGTDREVIGGFQSSSMDSVKVARSALDNEPGDEALRDAILRELREDAATTALEIDVRVDQRIARLRGRVPYLMDAENAEEVAARVPGLIEVREELDVDQTNR